MTDTLLRPGNTTMTPDLRCLKQEGILNSSFKQRLTEEDDRERECRQVGGLHLAL